MRIVVMSLLLVSLQILGQAPTKAPNSPIRKPIPENPAIAKLRADAMQGDVDAQYRLGIIYKKGLGVRYDYTEAFRWFKVAAEQGNVLAQFELASFCSKPEEKLQWYRKAAEQGKGRAQFELGNAYSEAKGVPQDQAEAVKWYRKAAEQGNAMAEFKMGLAYHDAKGVPENRAEAMKWFQLAAKQGSAGAQVNLGIGYFEGDSGQKDFVKAYAWFSLADARGATNAFDYKLKARFKLSPQDLQKAEEEAKKMIDEIKPYKDE